MSDAPISHGIGERFASPDDSKSYAEHLLYHKHFFAYNEALPYVTNQSTIEIGCGTAYGTNLLASKAATLLALDIEPQLIRQLAQNFATAKTRFAWYDGRHLPIDDGSIDAIVSFQVLEHVADDRNFLAEIRRVLKPHGVAILTTPNRLVRLRDSQKPFNNFHVREYSPSDLLKLSQELGFSVVLNGIFGDQHVQEFEIDRAKQYHAWYFRYGFQLLPRLLQIAIKSTVMRISRCFSKTAKEPHTAHFSFRRSTENIDNALDLWIELRHAV